MSKEETPTKDFLKRGQTDTSLQVERDRTDHMLTEVRGDTELVANEIISVARRRADELVSAARTTLAALGLSSSPTNEMHSAGDYALADGLIAQERAQADAVLGGERGRRKKYLESFLVTEREATDEDLDGERSHADTSIAARDEFLAIAAHDLRSLLTGFSLNSQLLTKDAQEGPRGDNIRKRGAASQRLVARMDRMVGDLLDAASIEIGKLAVAPTNTVVAELIRDTLEAFEPVARERHLTLAADIADSPTHVRCDGDRIIQVLANLVSNALKFTAAGGHVAIRVRLVAGALLFEVRDTGCGIPAPALTKIFERYHQVNRDRRGLGLGLYISKCIVGCHHGKMWVESVLQKGSAFYFTLPMDPLMLPA